MVANRIPEVEIEKEEEREEAERLAEEADSTPTRDYFRVEDTDGHRFWLYREGLYGSRGKPHWYLHGVSA